MKQGLVQDYTQRIEGANISGQKLSRLKLSRLRPFRHRLPRLSGSETGVGGEGGVGGPTKLYTHLLRFVKNMMDHNLNDYGKHRNEQQIFICLRLAFVINKYRKSG